MPKTDDPIVYRYTGRAEDGDALTGIPGRSLRQSDVDAMEPDAKERLNDHLKGEHRHIFSEVAASHEAAPEKDAEEPAQRSKAAKAGSEK